MVLLQLTRQEVSDGVEDEQIDDIWILESDRQGSRDIFYFRPPPRRTEENSRLLSRPRSPRRENQMDSP